MPSNLFLERVGARVWIARIMLTWGILSGAMAFIVGEKSFYAVRLLLGAAEAGFFPGIIFYLTLWFPARYRGRIISSFMIAIPLSSVIASPLSGALLGLDGVLGFKGWQWLYVLEALPAVILAGVVLVYLTDGRRRRRGSRRTSARGWCSASRTNGGRGNPPAATACGRPSPTGACSRSPFVYFGNVALLYGSASSCRRFVKGFDLTNFQTGLVTLIPAAIGIVGMIVLGRSSDGWPSAGATSPSRCCSRRAGRQPRRWSRPLRQDRPVQRLGLRHLRLPSIVWTLPTAFLSGAAAAGGIAIINALGNLSGFAAPYAVGAIKDATGAFTGGSSSSRRRASRGMVTVLCLRTTAAWNRCRRRVSRRRSSRGDDRAGAHVQTNSPEPTMNAFATVVAPRPDEAIIADLSQALAARCWASAWRRGGRCASSTQTKLTWAPCEPPDLVVYPRPRRRCSGGARLCPARRAHRPYASLPRSKAMSHAPFGGVSIDTSGMKRVVSVNADDLDFFFARSRPGSPARSSTSTCATRPVLSHRPGADARSAAWRRRGPREPTPSATAR